MQKLSKFLILITFGVLATFVGFGFKNQPSPIAETPPETSLTSSTSLKSTNSMFREIKTDGLASYLEIEINHTPSSIKTIKIIQTIGSTSQTLTTDETGKTCYYVDSLSASKNTTFYFTRPATYTVIYILNTNHTRVQESCTFAPELNTSVIMSNLYTIKNGTHEYVSITEDKIILTSSGQLNLPQNSLGLYAVTASVDGIDNNDLLIAIPNNAFGKVVYTIRSANGNTYLNLECIVLTIQFDVSFHDSNNNLIDESNHAHLDGYIFNEGVTQTLLVDSDATDLKGQALTRTHKKEVFDILNFEIEETTRNATNTAAIYTESKIIEKTESSDCLSIKLNDADHTIYRLFTHVAGATQNEEYKNNTPVVKVITKVPVNEAGNPIFSIILGQDPNYGYNDYVQEILNGYLKHNTTIYYSTVGIRIFYNGDAFSSASMSYTFNTLPGSITASKDFFHQDTTNGMANMRIFNSTLSFDQYVSFSFAMQGYKATNETFSSAMLNGYMFYNGDYKVTDDFGDVYNSINFHINSFKYVVSSTYEADCIPTHIRVTHNGTTYDDIHELSDRDELIFTNYGSYVIEFYNLPSYNFIVQNLQQWSSSAAAKNYYYKLDFTISGPSIRAITQNSNNEDFTITNNMYTQNKVNCDVNIQDGQKFVVYKNGNEITSKTESLKFNIDQIGTWKIVIFDSNENILKELTFTMVDKIYQGFSINEQIEFRHLSVYKQITKMPATYQKLDPATAYHLTQEGTYKIEIDSNESLDFSLNGALSSADTANSNSFIITITKSYFSLAFATGSNGSRINDKIIVSSVSGVQLQKLVVLKNGKSIKEFSADQLQDWSAVIEASRTFSDNGTYTFRLTDKYGNTYEAQIEKYYKVNVALIFLILILVSLLMILITTIIKTRHRVKVK